MKQHATSSFFFILLFTLFSWWGPVLSANGSDLVVYKIVGGDEKEYLPANYVKSSTFQRWQINRGGQLIHLGDGSNEEECSVKDEESEVDSRPKSLSISVKPTVNFVVKDGIPKYVFVGLWVHNEGHTILSNQHHYFGEQWSTFDRSATPNFHLEVLMGSKDKNVDRKVLGKVDSKRTKQAIEQLGIVLATTTTTNANDGDETSVGEGYHIISIPLEMDSMSNLDMNRGKGGTMMLTCIATTTVSSRESLQVLDMDEKELEENSAVIMSILQVEAFKVLGSFVKSFTEGRAGIKSL